MTLETMMKDKISSSFNGCIYRKKWELSDTEKSDALILPYQQIYGITIDIDSSGACKVYATNANETDITSDDANWSIWDGSSPISPAITALKAENTSGDTVVNVVVKTSLT